MFVMCVSLRELFFVDCNRCNYQKTAAYPTFNEASTKPLASIL